MKPETKARPILYRPEMVLATLEDRKSQTRRTKGLEYFSKSENDGSNWNLSRVVDGAAYFYYKHSPGEVKIECPYGKPGDLLYIREFVRYSIEHDNFYFDADRRGCGIEAYRILIQKRKSCPGIHMPRAISRITQRITNVRVQRLHEISVEDAEAEGLKKLSKDNGQVWKYGIPDRDGLPGEDDFGWHWTLWRQSPVDAYAYLWDQINGAGAWDANPWVWAITFEVIKRNVDEVLKEAA